MKVSFENEWQGREWWLTSIIPATCEAEIERTAVPEQTAHEIPSLK
jgi:hypothetical protein